MTSARMTNLYPLTEARLIIFLASFLLVFTTVDAATHIRTRFHHTKTDSSGSTSKADTATERSHLVHVDTTKTGHESGQRDKDEDKQYAKGRLGHWSKRIECGRVPIYEQAFTRSINKTAEELAARSGMRGDSRILHGLDAIVANCVPTLTRDALSNPTSTSSSTPPLVSQCKRAAANGLGFDGSCQYCTGTLIDSRWFVTAAHCLKGFKLGEGNSLTATLGLYDMIVPDETSIKAEVDKFILRPNADMFQNDMALVRLRAPVKFNEFIQPICLAPHDSAKGRNAHELARDKSCYTLGYGLDENWGFPSKLQKLEIKTAKCDKLQKEIKADLADQVCILPRRAEIGGTCKGDSGGPDVCYDERTNRWFIFGVVSFGPSDCNQESASGDWLTVSVDVTKYHQWISDTIKDND